MRSPAVESPVAGRDGRFLPFAQRHLLYLVYSLCLVASLAVAAWRPVLFQKLNSIASIEDFEPLVATSPSVKIEPLLRDIPNGSGKVWAVEPFEKYQQTMLEGLGNCSHTSYGMAYHARQLGADYQIISIIRFEGVDHSGSGLTGHAVIRLPMSFEGREWIGLLDVLYRGIPRTGGERFLDVVDLTRGAVPDFDFVRLNATKRKESPYFTDFLDSRWVGYIPGREVSRYFSFVETLYVPLGSERLEKHVYDGLALLLGFFPTTYFPEYDELMADHRREAVVFRASLWTLRSAVALVPAILGWELSRYWLRRRSRTRKS